MPVHVKDIRPDKVAIYIRWSTEDQGDGTTLVVQQEGCQHYVLSQGWRVTPSLVFVDDGYSGGSLDRPRMGELRRAVESGAIDCVVVYKLDRLSRSVMDTVNLVLDEWEGRTYLKSAREPIDTTSPMGKQFFYMLVSYAEWERNVIKERTFSGKLRRAKEGKNPGVPAAFGYRHSDQVGMLEIDPEKAELVRWMFKRYLDECGTYKLADDLNRSGIPSPTGLRWHKTTIMQILKNPVYTGMLVYARTTTNPRRQRDRSEPTYLKNPDPVIVEGQFPAIIERDVFDRAQALRQQRHKSSTGVRALASEHLLTGLLKCECGATMTSHVIHRKAKTYYYYQCQAKENMGRNACAGGEIPQHLLDAIVEQKVKELLLTEESYQNYLRVYQGQLVAQTHDVTQRREQATVALDSLEGQMRRLNRDYRNGELSASAYEENRQEIQADRDRFREQLAQLERMERALSIRLQDRAAFEQIVELVTRWDDLDVPRRKVVLRHVVERVTAFRRRKPRVLTAEVVWKVDEMSKPGGA